MPQFLYTIIPNPRTAVVQLLRFQSKDAILDNVDTLRLEIPTQFSFEIPEFCCEILPSPTLLLQADHHFKGLLRHAENELFCPLRTKENSTGLQQLQIFAYIFWHLIANIFISLLTFNCKYINISSGNHLQIFTYLV